MNKRASFSTEDQEIAMISKALSHPARVAILRYLAEQDSCICGDIVDELPLAQSTVSQHLSELKKSGLIKGSIEGPKTCYCIDPEKYDKLYQIMKSFLAELKELNQKTCC